MREKNIFSHRRKQEDEGQIKLYSYYCNQKCSRGRKSINQKIQTAKEIKNSDHNIVRTDIDERIQLKKIRSH